MNLIRRVFSIWVLLLPLCLPRSVEGALPQAQPVVDQSRVDDAVRKGAAFLRGRADSLIPLIYNDIGALQHDELVLWTLIHVGGMEGDPAFKKLFDAMLARKLERTYPVALQAMVLEEFDRARYQGRIQACAQFIVDNQCKNGQWGYGEPSIFAEEKPADSGKRKDVQSGGGTKPREVDTSFGGRQKPTIKNKVKVEKMKDGPEEGDNSNSQYAALGLRACYDAGVLLPPAVIEKTMTCWRTAQKNEPAQKAEKLDLDGTEARGSSTMAKQSFLVGPQGWCYSKDDDHGPHKGYGSMTGGAVGSLAIYHYIRDNDGGKQKSWKQDLDLLEGLQWLNKNFSVTHNPGFHEHGEAPQENSETHRIYFLYAFERAGMLHGTETLGSHQWYPEGARVLLETQRADGSWFGGEWQSAEGVVETCFAVLFLRRATRRLDVASVDRFQKEK